MMLYLWSVKNKEVHLIFSAGQEGGIYKPLAESIAKIVKASHPKITIEVIESHGSIENIQRLMNGDADLALVQNDIPGYASIYSIAPLYWEVLHFLVNRDSDIYKFRDIVNRTVSVGIENSGTERLVKNLLKHYGLSYDDINPIYLGISDAGVKLINGEIDVMFIVAGQKPSVCQEIVGSGKVRFVGFGNPEMIGNETEGFYLDYPYVTTYVIPVYSYPTLNRVHPGEPETPIATFALQSILTCHKDLPENIVFKILKTIFDNRIALIREHVSASQITENFDKSSLQFPLHPGAKTYFSKDKPSFFVHYSESLALILSSIIAIIGLITALRQWSLKRKKERIDYYFIELDKIMNNVYKEDYVKEDMKKIEGELLKIRQQVQRELIDERMVADDQFSIFLSLLSDHLRYIQTKLL